MMLPGLLLAAIGLFDQSVDVGGPAKKGSAKLERKSAYRVTGGGANMWAKRDTFHLLAKRTAGDVSITADVAFAKPGGNAHKKAGPILCAGTEADDIYADLVAHGDGLISMQYRRAKGAATEEVKTSLRAPATLRLDGTAM